jgi:glycosyltransferase involved in cell wall biosynthesis
MERASLSVVIPVYNEAAHLPETMRALVAAVDDSDFDAEVVVVDDGSTDGTADAARAGADGRLAVRIVSQPNRGRFEARRAGLAHAGGEYVLLLDSRVRLARGSLRFVHERLQSAPVWNGHVYVDADNAWGEFWRLLAELAWRDYFDDPRTTSFGIEEFDRYPKGTGCFLAPRALLESALAGFRSHYDDVRLANDDAPVLRAIAAAQRIHISPQFSCTYSPRTTFRTFLRHAIHRGTVFLDGHSTPESRFFPAVVAFFPLSLALMRRPSLIPAALAASGAAAALYGVRAGRSQRDVEVLATVTPVYAFGHAIGMWRGVLELVRP